MPQPLKTMTRPGVPYRLSSSFLLVTLTFANGDPCADSNSCRTREPALCQCARTCMSPRESECTERGPLGFCHTCCPSARTSTHTWLAGFAGLNFLCQPTPATSGSRTKPCQTATKRRSLCGTDGTERGKHIPAGSSRRASQSQQRQKHTSSRIAAVHCHTEQSPSCRRIWPPITKQLHVHHGAAK